MLPPACRDLNISFAFELLDGRGHKIVDLPIEGVTKKLQRYLILIPKKMVELFGSPSYGKCSGAHLKCIMGYMHKDSLKFCYVTILNCRNKSGWLHYVTECVRLLITLWNCILGYPERAQSVFYAIAEWFLFKLSILSSDVVMLKIDFTITVLPII